jgi:hypothetical protein
LLHVLGMENRGMENRGILVLVWVLTFIVIVVIPMGAIRSMRIALLTFVHTRVIGGARGYTV